MGDERGFVRVPGATFFCGVKFKFHHLQRADEDDECRALHPHLPEKPDASLSLGTLTLKDPWETVLFNDRALKHEVEAFDGDRPCSRCVIVQLTRKPLKDGTDTMLRD